MITDNGQQDSTEKWHYIALKSEIADDSYTKPTKYLSALYRGIASNHNGEFLCLGCMHSNRPIKNSKIMKEYVVNMIIAT